MLRSHEHWSAVADALNAAAFGGDWDLALDALSEACGADHGQLIGIGAGAAIQFNRVSGIDPAAFEEVAKIAGHGDPRTNPRVRVGARSAVLESWHAADCASEAVLHASPEYGDYCRRWDIPHGSQTKLVAQDGMMIGLSVLRGRAKGHPDLDEQRAFDALAPHVRSAVLTQISLEGHGAALVRGALETVGAAAFVCDRRGQVRAMTPAAEDLLSRGVLRLRHGRLSAASVEDSHALEAAVTRMAGDREAGAPQRCSVVLRSVLGPEAVEIADVAALPVEAGGFGFAPRVVVTVRLSPTGANGLASLLRRAFDLTAAEAEIALAMLDGQCREEIAIRRGVSIETVRSQVKSLFAKLDVRREAELAARLRRFQ